MPVFDTTLLGLIQGLTEFLPVSSDGHLAVAGMLLGEARVDAAGGGLLFTLVVHVATMLACTIRFRREIWALTDAFGTGPQAVVARKVAALIVACCIPTAAIGFSLRHWVEDVATHSRLIVGLGFLGTAAFLAATLLVPKREDPGAQDGQWLADMAPLTFTQALLIGVAQGVAVLPGLSRSAGTVSTAIVLGIPGSTAARFSLFASLPAIGGAFLLEALHARHVSVQPLPWLAGFATAFVVGWFAIGWLLLVSRKRVLAPFAAYTALLGGVLVVISLMK